MPARAFSINLLPKSEFEESFWGRFLKWSLTAGRYIIILTEIVVIVAFLSRFKLDSDLSDLADRIEGKRKVLEALSADERRFIQVQSRLKAAAKLSGKQMPIDGLLAELDGSIPLGGKIVVDQVAFSTDDVSFSGRATSETGLGELLRNLGQNKRWKSLELTDISSSKDKALTFSIVLKM